MTPTTPFQAFARAGWDAVASRLMAGLNHDLNGRIASIYGLVQLAQLEEGSPPCEYVEAEAQRLEEIVELLGLLSGSPAHEPEPMAVGEHLPKLLQLHARDRKLAKVHTHLESKGEVPPILVSWCVFTRAFLILLNEAGVVARDHGRGEVRVECGGSDEELRLSIVVPDLQPDTPAADPEEDSPAPWRLASEAVGEALAGSGATVCADHPTPTDLTFVMRFPSLATARQGQAAESPDA